MSTFAAIVRSIKIQIHFNQIKLKMTANNMSNIHVSADVLWTLMLLQQVKLQPQILHGISRSSRPKVFCKKAALKISAKFTEKHLCWSLFLIKFIKNNNTITQKIIKTPVQVIKKRLQYKCFPVNFAKF